MDQSRIGIEMPREKIQTAPEHVEHAGHVVPRLRSRLEEQFNAGGEFRRA